MIPSKIPPELLSQLRARLARGGSPLSLSRTYGQIAEVVDEYNNTVTRSEAAFILASRNRIDIRRVLDREGLDRIRSLLTQAPPSNGHGAKARIPREADTAAVAPTQPGDICRKRPIDVFDCCGYHPAVARVCRKLFRDGHYAQTVEAAFKLYNNTVKQKAGRPVGGKGKELDGSDLMSHVFSLSAPMLAVNELKNESQRNEQQGMMLLSQGVMTGLRNPRAHDHELQDDPGQALALLSLASYLMKKVDSAISS